MPREALRSEVSGSMDPGSRIGVRDDKRDQVQDDIVKTFGGVVIIDANDLGRNVLGNATEMPDEFFAQVMRDNPMGQGSEQTPLVMLMQ